MKFHFIGIGGIGMSGLARILLNQHHIVSGSDLSENPNVKTLRKLGALIHSSHEGQNIDSTIDYVVISSAIQENNPELIKAKELGLPILKRHEMLSEIIRGYKTVAITGTHGKTTTTALIGALFTQANLDPLVINGGIVNAFGSNVLMGLGSWCVVEADESDGSFLNTQPLLSVVTNIDLEHMEYFKTKDRLLSAFKEFIENTSILGCTCVCIDDELTRKVLQSVSHHSIVTYGKSEDADIRLEEISKNISGSLYTVKTKKQTYKDVFLPMMGEHNVINSLALIGLAEFLEIEEQDIRKALSNFSGVQRRFTVRGEIEGAVYVDDYAHHPKEIATVIKSAKQYGAKKIIAVVEPHRYSRVNALWDDYVSVLNEADEVVFIPLYGAFEKPIEGISSEKLSQKIDKQTHIVDSVSSLNEIIKKISSPGTVFLFMGAGKISKWCQEITQHAKDAA